MARCGDLREQDRQHHERRRRCAAAAELGNTEARLVRRVARSFRVSEEALFASGRTSARESLARHTAMYLMHVVLRRNYSEVAARFHRHRTSVLHACARIEDRRDDRTFDARIARLERSVAESEDAL